jgi:ribosomal subunit interface protein
MKQPLEIIFSNLEPSDAVEARVRERAEKLEHFYHNIMSCKVVIEAGHKHHYKGNVYHVRIDLNVPDAELVVSRAHDKNHAHEDVYVAIRDSFDAMRRQLEDYSRRRRGHVKTHEPPPHGRIAELNPDADFGKIATSDGKLVYFHRNSIVNNSFDHLKVGDAVRFSEEMGELGPQASTVHVEGKHHIVG